MIKLKIVLLIFTLFLMTTSCFSQPTFPYFLDRPDQTIVLPEILKEISGLAISADGKYLFAVQDELGTIFQLEKTSGKILKSIPFGKSGDYEGIEFVEGKWYILKSSGTLQQIENLGQPNQKVTTFPSFMTSENDAEGLVYDNFNSRLLIACKGWGETENKNQKSIYAFDLKTLTFSEKPVLTITKKQFIDFLAANPAMKQWSKLVEIANSNTPSFEIGPSGIAIHPKTKAFYLLSAKGNMLIILSQTGDLLHIHKLSKKIYPQPEGICFDANGDLFIANEAGESTEGKLYRFKNY